MARYSDKARELGELTAPEFARSLRCHINTVKNWARESVSGGCSKLPEGSVRRDMFGRWWIKREALTSLPTPDDYI